MSKRAIVTGCLVAVAVCASAADSTAASRASTRPVESYSAPLEPVLPAYSTSFGVQAGILAPPGTPTFVPNDPGYPAYAPAFERSDFPAAWNVTRGEGVLVASIDTGNAVIGDLPTPNASWNVAANNSDVSDQIGHGTATTSVFCGVINNAVGIAGAAQCSLMVFKISSDATGAASDTVVADAITRASQMGARVINVSYGEIHDGPPDSIPCNAVRAATNSLVVMSAGNDGRSDPAANWWASTCEVALRVGGVNADGTAMAAPSDYGSWVDVAAPFTLPVDRLDGGWGIASGTSFSAPFVTGEAALLLKLKPSLTPKQLKDLIMSSCQKPNGVTLPVACGGIVNAYAALVAAGYQPAVVVDITVNRSGSGTGSVNGANGDINCGTVCMTRRTVGSPPLVLTATPDPGSVFDHWEGACSGREPTCTLAVNVAATITAVFAKQVSLTVAKDGDGSGTVTDGVHAVDCGAACSATLVIGDSVSLSAVPGARSVFKRWSGGCSGSKPTCRFTMSQDTSVKATFAIGRAVLRVKMAGSGKGTIASAPAGIACGSRCAASFLFGSVGLKAKPTTGSRFVRWTGGCRGTRPTCVINVRGPISVTALFLKK